MACVCQTVVLFLSANPIVSAAGDAGDKLQLAQHMPLAARSLLLDVVRTTDGGLVAVGERGHVVMSVDGETWIQEVAKAIQASDLGLSDGEISNLHDRGIVAGAE